MNKTKVVLFSLALIPMFLSAGAANQTVVEEYTGALGASVEDRGAYGTIVYPPSDYSPVGHLGLKPLGGVDLRASSHYRDVVVSPADAVFNAEVAIAACFMYPWGDSTCNPNEDYPSAVACGGVELTDSPFLSNYVRVWVFSIHVETDLGICAGSSGSIAGTFFH